MPTCDPVFTRRLIQLRRELHRHPELSEEERDTAQRVSRKLTDLGVDHQREIAGHGIVAQIPGLRAGPSIALRADMDGLPIEEETGLEFASESRGVMHACGHDGHMTMLLGAAELLLREPAQLPVRLLFQPAEEIARGARGMVEAGVLEDVAMIFGGHIDRRYPTGQLVVTQGAVNASTDKFCIEIRGSDGHGARPHEARDAIVVGSQLVMVLQTIVSREINPAFPAVVSVGAFQAGSTHNVIAGHAKLLGTVRAQCADVRKRVLESIRRIARSTGELFGAEIEVSFTAGPPPLVNTEAMAQLAREAAEETVGAQNVCELSFANMGGEDFAVFLERVPGAYIRFGAQIAGAADHPAHSSRFDFDEAALPIGAHYLHNVARLAAAGVPADP